MHVPDLEVVHKLSFNKLNNYGKHMADKGNSMLPIHMGKVKTLAILDTGAGVSIATKAMWIKWGTIVSQKNLNGVAARGGHS